MACHVSVSAVPCRPARLQTSLALSGSFSGARAVTKPRSICRSYRHNGTKLRASGQDIGSQTAPQQSQMSVELMKQMEASISEALHAEKVKVQDAYGDGRHVSIEVISADFEGQSSVKRQRLVYKVICSSHLQAGNLPCCNAALHMQAIWQELQDTVHAVDSMVTKTPAEIAS